MAYETFVWVQTTNRYFKAENIKRCYSEALQYSNEFKWKEVIFKRGNKNCAVTSFRLHFMIQRPCCVSEERLTRENSSKRRKNTTGNFFKICDPA